MFKLMQTLRTRRENEEGASAVEYGLLVAAIAAIIVLIVFAIGKFVREGFQVTCDNLSAQSTLSAASDCNVTP